MGVSNPGRGSPPANFGPRPGFFEAARKLMPVPPNFKKNIALAFLKAA